MPKKSVLLLLETCFKLIYTYYMQQQKVIILDFGSQTTQLIARRLRELDTFCEILPYNKFPAQDPDVIGVILAGSPYSVYDPQAFKVDLSQFRGRMPILGICYGAQFMSHTLGGKAEPAGTFRATKAETPSRLCPRASTP